jgi:hypothetical protein
VKGRKRGESYREEQSKRPWYADRQNRRDIFISKQKQ